MTKADDAHLEKAGAELAATMAAKLGTGWTPKMIDVAGGPKLPAATHGASGAHVRYSWAMRKYSAQVLNCHGQGATPGAALHEAYDRAQRGVHTRQATLDTIVLP